MYAGPWRFVSPILLAMLCAAVCRPAEARPPGQDEAGVPFPEQPYRTPLAGEELYTEVLGVEVHVPARDRANLTAVNVGALFFLTEIADDRAIPFAAFYARRCRCSDRIRFRAALSGVVNDICYANGGWNDAGFELVANWENHTVPLPRAEVYKGEELDYSELLWGTLCGRIGIGWRVPIGPGEFDNGIMADLTYGFGYFYCKSTHETADEWITPPDTPYHTLRFRIRCDSFRRNIMELLHRGFGAGLIVEFGWRERWSDHGLPPDLLFDRERTRDYLKVTGYMLCSMGLPFLSERHTLSFHITAAWAPHGNLDRFTAFRAGGGPPPSEANDLSRHPFPGALFEQVLTERFFIVTMEYRYELFFFCYLHLRGTLAWGRMLMITPERIFKENNDDAQALSVGITCGFFFDSVIYAEYVYHHGPITRNESGHSVMFTWSKAF